MLPATTSAEPSDTLPDVLAARRARGQRIADARNGEELRAVLHSREPGDQSLRAVVPREDIERYTRAAVAVTVAAVRVSQIEAALVVARAAEGQARVEASAVARALGLDPLGLNTHRPEPTPTMAPPVGKPRRRAGKGGTTHLVAEALNETMMTVRDIADITGLHPSQVSNALTTLRATGRAVNASYGQWTAAE